MFMIKAKVSVILIAFVFVFFAETALADTRPNPPAKRTHEETKRLLQLGKHLRCSFAQNFEVYTKDGQTSPDEDSPKNKTKILFDSLAPEASSPSDFAIYSLSWKNDDFDFYFFMNSQIGEIRILDKKNGLSAETHLDLSDFGKEEVFVGKARLIQIENLLVTSPLDPDKKVPGERLTYLRGSCQFLNGYIP